MQNHRILVAVVAALAISFIWGLRRENEEPGVDIVVATSDESESAHSSDLARKLASDSHTEREPSLPLDEMQDGASGGLSTMVSQPSLSFERLYEENKDAADMHSAFLLQPRDPSVAYAMENALREFYSGRPQVLQYGMPDIQCGSDFCEVRLIANSKRVPLEWARLMLSSNSPDDPESPYQVISMAMLEGEGETALTFLLGPPKKSSVLK